MAGNSKKFPELKKRDVVAFVVSTDDEQLGDGKTVPSWVWSDFKMMQGEGPEKVREYYGESKSNYTA